MNSAQFTDGKGLAMIDHFKSKNAEGNAANRVLDAMENQVWQGSRFQRFCARRMLGIILGSTVVILMLPIMLLIGLIICLDSPGPALFFQKRLGQGCNPFTFVKFRTLYVDARERFPELYAYKYTAEQLVDLKFKVDADPRVTRCGTWLRRSSLDELPNFWNVITGEMALVGPRPEIPEMLPYYRGAMLMKFSVRPGVTGPAQISGRGRLTFYDTVALDLDYVKNRSFRRDVVLLFSTVRKVILRDGAF